MRSDGKRRIFIGEGTALIFAQLRAAMAGFGGTFVEAHTLDERTAKVSKAMIGRTLTDREVRALLRRIA
jgi:hypothetical protein